MRLVDIDDTSLLKTIADGRLSAKAVWRLIRAQPTIDAIPVSWLKEYVNRMYKENQIFVAYPIEDMLKAWESENA